MNDRIAALLGGAVVERVPLAGGDLSAVHRVTLDDGRVAIAKFGGDAMAEAAMLRAIAATGAPAPMVLGAEGDLLLLEQRPADGHLDRHAWDDLASVLSRLHRMRGRSYGWHADYAFGTVAIRNTETASWPAFWAEHRLRCHLPHLSADLACRVEKLAETLDDRLPAQPPAALLHGDLWGGNILVSAGRIAALIDPACYHGDREVDVAMLTLFDRPPPRFFEAMALAPGWRERLPIYRLWPLLVHLRLFGAAYERRIWETLAEIDPSL